MTYNVFSGTLNPTRSINQSDVRDKLHWLVFWSLGHIFELTELV